MAKPTKKDIATLKYISEDDRVFHKAWIHHITFYSLERKGLIDVHDGGLITISDKGKSLILY